MVGNPPPNPRFHTQTELSTQYPGSIQNPKERRYRNFDGIYFCPCPYESRAQALDLELGDTSACKTLPGRRQHWWEGGENGENLDLICESFHVFLACYESWCHPGPHLQPRQQPLMIFTLELGCSYQTEGWPSTSKGCYRAIECVFSKKLEGTIWIQVPTPPANDGYLSNDVKATMPHLAPN